VLTKQGMLSIAMYTCPATSISLAPHLPVVLESGDGGLVFYSLKIGCFYSKIETYILKCIERSYSLFLSQAKILFKVRDRLQGLLSSHVHPTQRDDFNRAAKVFERL
jgi:hypothetical protein